MTISAASTIRDARTRARLTQAELGARARIAQSVVSSYESARREPSIDMLQRIVGAAGFELQLSLAPAAPLSRLQAVVRDNRLRLRRELQALGASNIRLFGSVARGEDGPESDVDVLVDIPDTVGLFTLGRMQTAAEVCLGVRVDVVPANSLRPDVRERVLRDAIPL
jgi:predicted nucleotidyltransferase/DNA-binding XRE family transcriptional regulator